jgi:hypothetical protein
MNKYGTDYLYKTYEVNLYTYVIGEHFTLSLTEDGKNVIRTPYPVEIKDRERKEYDDEFFDYLLCTDLEFSEDEITLLKDNGYDLDRSHYATIQCPYLPFVHFLHLIENWTI